MMLDFISGCTGLFNHIFNAVYEVEYFKFLIVVLLFLVFLRVFLLLSRGFKKM